MTVPVLGVFIPQLVDHAGGHGWAEELYVEGLVVGELGGSVRGVGFTLGLAVAGGPVELALCAGYVTDEDVFFKLLGVFVAEGYGAGGGGCYSGGWGEGKGDEGTHSIMVSCVRPMAEILRG